MLLLKCMEDNVKLLNLFRQKLWIKVMIPVMLSQVIVLGTIILINIKSQQNHQTASSRHATQNMALAIEGSMIDALAIGDNEIVIKQFERLKEKIAGLDVMIFDFNGLVSFSTDQELVGKMVADYIPDTGINRQVQEMLATGQPIAQPLQERINNDRHLNLFRPINNEPRCFHCHGQSRNVLGGIQVRTSIEGALQAAQTTRNYSLLGGVAGIALLGAIVFLLFNRLVSNPVRKLLDLGGSMRQGDLTRKVEVRGIDEVSHMSARMNLVNDSLRNMIQAISASSRELSQGSASQASSLQESSASINQMTSIIKQNMDSADHADHLMKSAEIVFKGSKESMQEVTTAMDSIKQTSRETSQIIKTIDEIAFQTNLLALNASVEAARAGEAGAGFAVVADEVRNLAMRAADAASSTSQLIDEIVRKIEHGSGRVGVTNEKFVELSGKIDEFSRVITEIASASHEQSQGIEEINKAVAAIDGTTQKNADLAAQLADSTAKFTT